MTLSELARLANVSISVASKAFSGKDGVSDAMREHVFKVAKQHGCFHQFYNIPYDRQVVAVIIPEAISKYYIKYVEAIKSRLEQNNCTMLLSISNFDSGMEQELIRYYSEHGKVDGLVVVNGNCDFPNSDDTVFVKIAGESENADITVRSDKVSGIDECLETLRSYGHKRIAIIGESLTVDKEELVWERMKALEIEAREEYRICSPYRFERAGEDGIRKLMALPEPPTAVIGSYGYITCGIISELERMNIKIPDEMSVISFDLTPTPGSGRYSVACVDYNIDQLCDIAVEELCLRLRSKKRFEKRRILLDEVFHLGNTIAKVR